MKDRDPETAERKAKRPHEKPARTASEEAGDAAIDMLQQIMPDELETPDAKGDQLDSIVQLDRCVRDYLDRLKWAPETKGGTADDVKSLKESLRKAASLFRQPALRLGASRAHDYLGDCEMHYDPAEATGSVVLQRGTTLQDDLDALERLRAVAKELEPAKIRASAVTDAVRALIQLWITAGLGEPKTLTNRDGHVATPFTEFAQEVLTMLNGENRVPADVLLGQITHAVKNNK